MRGHWSGSPATAPGSSCSPSNMKVSASAAMSSSDRVWPFSSCGGEIGHGLPGATSLWPNPIHGHHSSPMPTTLWAPPSHWQPALWSMLPMATTVPLWPPVYTQPPHGHQHPTGHWSMTNPSPPSPHVHHPMAATTLLTTFMPPWPPPQPHLGEQQEIDEVHAASPVAVQPGLVAQAGECLAPALHHISSEGVDSGTGVGEAPAIRGEAVEPPRVEKWPELAPDHQ